MNVTASPAFSQCIIRFDGFNPYAVRGFRGRLTLGPFVMEKLERRLHWDGTALGLDPAFASGGIATLDFEGEDDSASAAIVQSDGKIIAGGLVRYTSSVGGTDQGDIGVARFNADGTPDATFGAGGKVVFNFGTSALSSIDILTTLAVQSDGSILVGGEAINLTTPND